MLTCDICGRTIADMEAAVEAGWEPSYYLSAEPTAESGEPICPTCSADYCYDHDAAGATLRPDVTLPVKAKRVTLYTSAQVAYDGFSVYELDGNAGADNRGMVIRKVSVEERDIEWYKSRCDSGCHGVVTEDEAREFPTIWRLKGGD